MVQVEVCVGSACHLKGSYNVIHNLMNIVKDRALEDNVLIKAAFCLGNCTNGVSVRINEGEVKRVKESSESEFFDKEIAPLL